MAPKRSREKEGKKFLRNFTGGEPLCFLRCTKVELEYEHLTSVGVPGEETAAPCVPVALGCCPLAGLMGYAL